MPHWFDISQAGLALLTLVACGAVAFAVARAVGGRRPRLRPLAGVGAIEEAVGRATEQGRPVLFVPGSRDMDDVQTLAALSILGEVARMTARHGCRLIVPTNRSLVLSAAREASREAYVAAGRADSWDEEMVTYVSDDQFGYVAHVDGLIARERPGACIYMGAYSAESLLLAEAGNQVGALQVAGTAMPLQLPFFVAACDQTLLGEELFAASAYITRDAGQLGSLAGQDFVKRLAIVLIVGGALLMTAAQLADPPWLAAAAAWTQRLLGGGG